MEWFLTGNSPGPRQRRFCRIQAAGLLYLFREVSKLFTWKSKGNQEWQWGREARSECLAEPGTRPPRTVRDRCI